MYLLNHSAQCEQCKNVRDNHQGVEGILHSPYKLYLCKWDREHTILAVGIGADENAGKVLRETLVFTKAGAFPVSEFVDPEARAAACGKAATTHTASVRRYKR